MDAAGSRSFPSRVLPRMTASKFYAKLATWLCDLCLTYGTYGTCWYRQYVYV